MIHVDHCIDEFVVQALGQIDLYMASLEVPQCCQLFGVSSLTSDCRRLFANIVSVGCPYRSVRKLHVRHCHCALEFVCVLAVCFWRCDF